MPKIDYNIFDLGFNKLLTKVESPLDLSLGFQMEEELAMPSILGSGFFEIPPNQIGSGELIQNISMVSGHLQSFNFVSGSIGWQILYDGSVEFNSGIFRGTLEAGSIHIPDENTTANSFHADSDGNAWWGCTHTDFDTNNDNANAYVLATGVAKFQSITVVNATVTTPTITGGTLAIGSSNNIFKADANGIYLGNATFASAPFRVNMAGALVATSAIITGTIQTASSGQRILIDGANNLIRFYDSGGVDRGTIYGIPTGIGITGDIDAGSVNLTCFHLLLNDAAGAAIEVTWNNSVDIGTTSHRFKDIYLGGNLVVGGLVDGVDIAAHDGGAVASYHTGTIGSTMHGTLTGIPSSHHSSLSDNLSITPANVDIKADGYIKRAGTSYVRLISNYFDMYKPIGMNVIGSDPANYQGGFFFSSASGRFRGNDTGGASWRDICFYDERNDASPLLTFVSGLDELKKIKEPTLMGENLFYNTNSFPKKFLSERSGKIIEDHIDLKKVIGMLIKGQKELLEKVEILERI